MRKFLIFIWLLLESLSGLSQERSLSWSELPSGMTLTKINLSGFEFNYSLSSLSAHTQNTELGAFIKLSIKGHSKTRTYGQPELPVFSRLIEIPPGTGIQINILSEKKDTLYLDQQGIKEKIFPAQFPVNKTRDPEKQPLFIDKSIYKKDTLLQTPTVVINEPGTMHGRRFSVLSVSPFSYNPLKNILVVTTELRVRIDFTGVDQERISQNSKRFFSGAFQPIGESAFNSQAKSVSVPGPEKYVILSDTMFREALKPFVEWKTRKGFEVVEVYKGTPGVGTTAEEMKSYLSNMYHAATENDPAFSYLLIVGDDAQIPAFRPSHISDLYYAEYDGNGDYFPDVMYGRFSARDTAELNPQIEKTLEYEQYLFPDPSFLNEAVMIAGVDGTYATKWGNGQINYANQYYINTGHGITSHTYLYPASGSSDAQILQDISNGVGFVNYTGHGEWDRWLDPRFHLSDIPGLQNAHRYPLMIGNGCVTTTFQIDECFGEALLRAKNKGALGYIGCSNDSYWDEDYWWATGVGIISANPLYEETSQAMYDLTFHEHNEDKSLWARTQSQMIFAGNMAVTTGSPGKSKYYWEIYHLMGDPSLMVYFSEPDSLHAVFPDTLPIGSNLLQIITLPDVYAGLNRDGELLAAGYANKDGLIDLNFPAQSVTGTLDLVLTGQNLKPVITTLEVAAVTGTFIMPDSISVNDALGNNNGLPDFDETISFDIALLNSGGADALDVTTTLKVQDPFLTITDSVYFWGNINSGALVSQSGKFRVDISDSIPDEWPVTFTLLIEDQSGTSRKAYFETRLLAPVLHSGTMIIDDKTYGNGNSRLEPGETADLKIEITNQGHSSTTGLYARLYSADTLIQILNDSSYLNIVDPGTVALASFRIRAHPGTVPGTRIGLEFTQTSGKFTVEAMYDLYPGLIYEGFESAGFSSYRWQNTGTYPWEITGNRMYEGLHAAQSGFITHNRISELSIDVDVPEDDTISFYRKVSSESNYDILRFYINGTLQDQWSGEVDWALQKYPVAAGSHTFKWAYSKDGTVSRGSDRAWIDFIVFPKNSFLRKNTGIVSMSNPASGLLLSVEDLVVDIRNFGTDTLPEIPAGYILDDGSAVYDTLKAGLLPGQDTTFTFSRKMDLSATGPHTLKIFTILNGDEIPSNDTLRVTIEHQVADLSAVRYAAPGDTTVYTSNETVTIVVRNLGTYPVSDIPVGYRINSQSEVLETAIPPATIQPGDSLEYTFNTTADLSAYGTYIIKAFTRHSMDLIESNDTVLLTLIHDGSSNVIDFENDFGVSVFPNPFTSTLNLLFEHRLARAVILSIHDITGRTVYRAEWEDLSPGQQLELDLQFLTKGLYILCITHENSGQEFKLIKH